jgi:Phage integrase, N-terminal SAM-like domain
MRGHVRERGKGNWYAVLSVRDPQSGKRKVQWRSLPGCKGKREAQQQCARILVEMQSGGYVAPEKTTVARLLERWLTHIKTQVAPASYERYAELVHNNIVPSLGATKLTSCGRNRFPRRGAGRSLTAVVMAPAGFLLRRFTICIRY